MNLVLLGLNRIVEFLSVIVPKDILLFPLSPNIVSDFDSGEAPRCDEVGWGGDIIEGRGCQLRQRKAFWRRRKKNKETRNKLILLTDFFFKHTIMFSWSK